MVKIKTNFYNITPYNNLLYIESFSAWDERVAKQYIADLMEVVLKLYTKAPWAVIHDSRLWDLGTPGAEYLLSKLVSTSVSGTLKHHAMIVDKSELKKWQIANIFRDVTLYENKFFTNLESALEWLESLGYYINIQTEKA